MRTSNRDPRINMITGIINSSRHCLPAPSTLNPSPVPRARGDPRSMQAPSWTPGCSPGLNLATPHSHTRCGTWTLHGLMHGRVADRPADPSRLFGTRILRSPSLGLCMLSTSGQHYRSVHTQASFPVVKRLLQSSKNM